MPEICIPCEKIAQIKEGENPHFVVELQKIIESI